MDARCSAATKTGAACNAAPWRDRLCRWHHPDLAAERREGRAKGGHARSNAARARKRLPGRLLTMREVQALLCGLLVDVVKGEAETGVATSAAGLARAIAAVATAGDLEDRLAALEATAGPEIEGRRAS